MSFIDLSSRRSFSLYFYSMYDNHLSTHFQLYDNCNRVLPFRIQRYPSWLLGTQDLVIAMSLTRYFKKVGFRTVGKNWRNRFEIIMMVPAVTCQPLEDAFISILVRLAPVSHLPNAAPTVATTPNHPISFRSIFLILAFKLQPKAALILQFEIRASHHF